MNRYSDDQAFNLFVSFKFCQHCGSALSSNDNQNEINYCPNCIYNQRFVGSRILYSDTNVNNNLNECNDLKYFFQQPSDPSYPAFSTCSSGSSNRRPYSKPSQTPLVNRKIFDWSHLEINNCQDNNNFGSRPKKTSEVYDAETMRQVLDTHASEVSSYEDGYSSERNSVMMDVVNSDEERQDISKDSTPEYERWLEESMNRGKNENKLSDYLESRSPKSDNSLKRRKQYSQSFSQATSSTFNDVDYRTECVKQQALQLKKRNKKRSRKRKSGKNKSLKKNKPSQSCLETNNQEEISDNYEEAKFAISDLVENGLENVPFEQLVKHYNDIQKQLEELSKEEEKQARDEHVKEEKNVEEMAKFLTNDCTKENKDEVKSVDKDSNEDDDLIQLRLLALNSKKANRLQTQSLAFPEIKEVSNNDVTITSSTSIKDDDLNEDELRATLLKSIVSKKL